MQYDVEEETDDERQNRYHKENMDMHERHFVQQLVVQITSSYEHNPLLGIKKLIHGDESGLEALLSDEQIQIYGNIMKDTGQEEKTQKRNNKINDFIRKTIMNKLLLISLFFSSNILLSDQEKPQTPADKSVHFNLTPLYVPDPEYIKQTSRIPENIDPTNKIEENSQKTIKQPAPMPDKWILESAIENAPELLKGISLYLQSQSHCIEVSQNFTSIPSFHRFILVGPPGSGKTTMAYAIAYMLRYPTVFIPATRLLGQYRNQTAINIQKFLKDYAADGLKKVIIIDELHKLFEHHDSEQTDHSQTAAAFWLALDDIEKHNPESYFYWYCQQRK